MGDPIRALTSIGLSETKAKETLKNEAVSRNILSAVASARAELNLNDDSPFEKTIGNLLYHIGTKIKPRIADRIPLLSQYVVKGWIDSEARLNAALAFLTDHLGPDLDLKAFDEAIGKGIVVTSEDIEKKIAKLIAGNKEQLVSERYSFNFGKLLGSARDELKWGDGKEIKNELDVQILELLGPKTAEELSGKKKPAKEKSSNESNKNDNKKQEVKKNKVEVNGEVDGDASKDTSQTVAELMKSPAMAALHAPGKNHTTDGYQVTPKTAELLAAHLKRTGGQVRTRFPPEPNGVLHIGHAKAIHVNFGYAAANNGICFLRYDDTNPEKEEEKFFVAIKEMVEWLGYKPYKITHSSDYFEELYQMAETLIEKGLAYVCHQKQEEIKGFDPPPSPWRNRDVEENLKLFRAMRDGAFDEGEAVLRLKHILEEGKQDPVAYRIKYVPHHRTGDVWCIYPTYDYTHCLCDSLEDITHSLCTKEFQSRRSSYYWLCNVLEVYCPVQWEYARLNVHRTVVSKRKIAALITNQMVHDWDDPRLFTLTALRRRGVPPAAINNFVARLGLSGAQMAVGPEYLDACVRDTLNVTAPRTMVVLDPLKLVITNLQVPRKSVDVPDFPSVTPSASGDSKGKTHSVLLTPVLFIERSDFRDGEKVDKDYRRLTINQAVGLRHAGLVVSVERVVRNPDGHVVELFVKCTPAEEAEKKPKAFIHWVSEPKTVEVRLYEHLFVHQHPEDPEEVPGGFLSDINPNSLTIIKEALCDEYLVRSKPSVHSAFQFERHGFFAIDPDSDFDAGKLVFNRTVSLKEDTGKNK